jgi:uncharacterized DUF497 family protein
VALKVFHPDLAATLGTERFDWSTRTDLYSLGAVVYEMLRSEALRVISARRRTPGDASATHDALLMNALREA